MVTSESTFLLGIFEDKLIEDDCQQIELFHSELLGKTVILRAPLIMFWVQLLMVAGCSMIFTAFLGVIVYKQIIQQNNTQVSYIVGYGIVIPLSHFFSHLCVDFLDIQNKMIRFSVTLGPLLAFFRTLEAMYGFSPKGAQKSLQSYIRYFLAYGDVEFDHESNDIIKPKKTDVINKLVSFFKLVVFVGLLNSFMAPFNYFLFETGIKMNSFTVSPLDLLSFGHLINMFSAGILLQAYLAVFSIPLGIVSILILNVQVPYVMKNAIFGSASPTDFWSKKWNRLIHALLKRGVYKPVRTHFPVPVAVLSTFIVSGLFHEWILTVIIRENDEACDKCFYPNRHGGQIMFFLWNAMIVFLEFILVRSFPEFFQYFGKRLHPVVKSLVLAMTGLPIVHWFMTDYLHGHFFQFGQIAFPRLILQDK